MPWHRRPTKGAASRDSPRGGAHGLRSGGTRTGEPDRVELGRLPLERIRREGGTGGTETSKYPEEEKSIEMPGVAASETGRRPNRRRATPCGGCAAGVAGRGAGVPQGPGGVTNRSGSGTAWEGRRHRVTAPYAKPLRLPDLVPEYAPTRGTGAESGGTALQA